MPAPCRPAGSSRLLVILWTRRGLPLGENEHEDGSKGVGWWFPIESRTTMTTAFERRIENLNRHGPRWAPHIVDVIDTAKAAFLGRREAGNP